MEATVKHNGNNISSYHSICKSLVTSGQTPLLSRFVGAFSPGWPTVTNDSGLMLVPVGPRTGTKEGPRGQARSEGGGVIGPGW